jgi:hypothetical protein
MSERRPIDARRYCDTHARGRIIFWFYCASVAALLTGAVWVASASAEVVKKPEGIKEEELIADNGAGRIEKTVPFTMPAGYYQNEPYGEYGSTGNGGDGVYEYTEECEEGNIFEHCKGLHTVVNQNSAYPLLPGYTRLEHLGIESDYLGERTVTIWRYAWKPMSEPEQETFGSGSGGEPNRDGYSADDPVNCATGNQFQTQTDLAVGGRGPTLGLTLHPGDRRGEGKDGRGRREDAGAPVAR